MNKNLQVYNISVNKGFRCYSWWHRLWHRFEVTDHDSGGTWCSHETWLCSCGKVWKVDKSWVEGTVFIRGEEMPRLDDMAEGEVKTIRCSRCSKPFTHLKMTAADQPVPTKCWACQMEEGKI